MAQESQPPVVRPSTSWTMWDDLRVYWPVVLAVVLGGLLGAVCVVIMTVLLFG